MSDAFDVSGTVHALMHGRLHGREEMLDEWMDRLVAAAFGESVEPFGPVAVVEEVAALPWPDEIAPPRTQEEE